MPKTVNYVDLTLPSAVANSQRKLIARNIRSVDLTLSIEGKNSVGDESSDAIITIGKDDAVRLAVEILRSNAPEKLTKPEPTFSETPVGTFLRNKGTGKVVRVVEWDERFDGYVKDSTVVSAVDADGDIVVACGDPYEKKYVWEVVQAIKKTVFQVVE